MSQKIRTYSDLMALDSFEDRFEYLKLSGTIGVETFGSDRYINQVLYHSSDWGDIRNKVIMRDLACDLAHPDYEIHGKIIIHHMNPITANDILSRSEFVLDPEFLITTTINTHNAIHYGDASLLPSFAERSPNDTCPWRK